MHSVQKFLDHAYFHYDDAPFAYSMLLGKRLTLDTHALQGYSTRFVCVSVYLSVTTLIATYIIFKSKVGYRVVVHGVLNYCHMWLSLNVLFKSNGIINLSWLPLTFPDKLSTDVRNSTRFLSRQRVSTFNSSICKIAKPSLFRATKFLS